MNPEYVVHSQGAHGSAEELQWARLIASGSPRKGMIVIFLQKMCAAYHEFEPAFRAGALSEGGLAHFRQRLANRVGVVLAVMQTNGLPGLDGYSELARLQQATLAAGSLAELAGLAEPVHMANHQVTDALEKME